MFTPGGNHPLELLIEIRNATHQGQPVIVILVSPMPADELLEISEERNNRERRLILVRDRGEVGQVRELQGRKEIRALEDRREQALRDPLYQQLWQRFLLSSRSVACSPPDKDIEPRVAAYCHDVQAHLAKWHDLFTPLDAEEDLKARDPEIFEPEAVESLDYFASDDPWDEEMADDPEDDEEEKDLDGLETPELDESPLRIPRRASVFELLKQEPRAVLLGEPGGGKTTCLQRLTLEAAGAYQAGGQVTVFVPLSCYTEAGLRALVARILKVEWAGVAWLIQQRRLVLLLDAFNECPRLLQEQCGQEVMALLRDYPELPLVISSRSTAYRFDLRLPAFVVRPLDRDQQQQFLTIYLKSQEKAAAILEKLYQQPGGEIVASSPILLRMVVEVSHRRGELPAGRAQLYHRFFADWYEREQKKERRTGIHLRWSFDLTLEALGHLAFHSRKEGMVTCDLDWAIRNLRPVLLDESRRFLERMAQGLLLTLDMETQTLTFSHETLQEYLAAEYLLRESDALFSLPVDQWDMWRMPLAYVFELTDSVPDNIVKMVWLMEPTLLAVALRDNRKRGWPR